MDGVGEVGLVEYVGGCVGDVEGDWMAGSSGGLEEGEYEVLSRDDGRGENGSVSCRLE